METPSPYIRSGQTGIGEGGAIAPPAAVADAVNDALKDLGAELPVSPITPRRMVEAIAPAAWTSHLIPEAEPQARPSGTSERGSPAARSAPSIHDGRLHMKPAAFDYVTEDAQAVTAGAAVTRAAIDDGRQRPDPECRGAGAGLRSGFCGTGALPAGRKGVASRLPRLPGGRFRFGKRPAHAFGTNRAAHRAAATLLLQSLEIAGGRAGLRRALPYLHAAIVGAAEPWQHEA